jgi:alpha-L-arabinofuranosidase
MQTSVCLFQGFWHYQGIDERFTPVLAVYAGLSLNGDVTPENRLQQFIDDALDEIEFVIGPATSKWGAVRASLGHPEPFSGMIGVEVGNEDWLAGGDLGWNTYYRYRFPDFQAAINDAYPDLEILYSGSAWDTSSSGIRHPPQNPAIGDYHPYREPDALVEEFDRFDNQKVRHIVGEVAAVHVNNGTEWEGDL